MRVFAPEKEAILVVVVAFLGILLAPGVTQPSPSAFMNNMGTVIILSLSQLLTSGLIIFPRHQNERYDPLISFL